MGAMGRLLFLVFLADLALLVIALIDCLSADGDEIRALPKAVWVLFILFLSPLGPIAYLLAGRPRRDDDAGAPAWHPAGSAAGRAPRDLAPDDNPEFLRELSARTRRTDGAIVTEPTGLRVGVAHRGFVAFELTTEGRAAHGSRPDLGIDAIAKMGRVLVGLEALDRALRARPTHPLLGSGSLHASVIAGGQEYSSYPASCTLQAERRTIPGETVEFVEAELATLLERLRGDDADLRATWRRVFSREPFEIAPDDPFVELVNRHAGAELGGEAFWTDAALLADAGIPTVLYGPGGEGAHAAVEWVDLAPAERCREVLLAVAIEFCA